MAHADSKLKPVNADDPPPGSIADAYRKVLGSVVVKARNDRLAGVALWADKLRVRGDGLPRILVYSTCRNLIRTIPALPRDVKRPEDVDTHAEDHAYDSSRYLLMELEGRPSLDAAKNAKQANRDTQPGTDVGVPVGLGGITTGTGF